MHLKTLRQPGQRLAPFNAAKVTFVLYAGMWLRRGRLMLFFPSPGEFPRLQLEHRIHLA